MSKFKHRDIPVLSGYLQAISVVVALARMTTENQKLYYKEMKSGLDSPLDRTSNKDPSRTLVQFAE